MPVAARRQLNDLPDELWTKISIEFYKDAADAVFKALLVGAHAIEADDKPTTIAEGGVDGDPAKIRSFQWTASAERNAASSADALRVSMMTFMPGSSKGSGGKRRVKPTLSSRPL